MSSIGPLRCNPRNVHTSQGIRNLDDKWSKENLTFLIYFLQNFKFSLADKNQWNHSKNRVNQNLLPHKLEYIDRL